MKSEDPINPLTIIAIFAGIIEASALASLPFLSEKSQTIYTWFLVGFPFFLTVLFFLTLNFNSVSLYRPSVLPGQHAGQSPGTPSSDGEPIRLVMSGADSQQALQRHVLGVLAHSPTQVRRWLLYDLERRMCVDLSLRPMADGEDGTPL